MDQERLQKLFYGQEYMGIDLLTRLNHFKLFSEKTKPVVTVLCSENKLRMNMDKLICNHVKVDFHVCGTYNGTDEALEHATFSDAIIVNTLALKIAPEGLYKILKAVSSLGKEIYVILSGWESLPKTLEMAHKKLQKADENFDFCKISMCRNVYGKPLDGFYDIQDVLTEIEDRCTTGFSYLHEVQTEALFKQIKTKVIEFRQESQRAIKNEQAQIDNMYQVVCAKQRLYEITFSHVTIDVTDSLERFERSIKELSVDDVVYQIEQENSAPALDVFKNSPEKAESIARKLIAQRICDAMDGYLEQGNSTLGIQSGAQTNGVVDDLQLLMAQLKSCRFVPEDELTELLNKVNSAEKLIKFSATSSNALSLIFAKTKSALKPKIMAFQYEYQSTSAVSNVISGIKTTMGGKGGHQDTSVDNVSFVRNTSEMDVRGTFESATPPENTMFPSTNTADHISETRMLSLGTAAQMGRELLAQAAANKEQDKWEEFRSETMRLITFSKNMMSSLLDEFSRMSNEEIEIQSKNTVCEYFNSITSQLEKIEKSMDVIADSFGGNSL